MMCTLEIAQQLATMPLVYNTRTRTFELTRPLPKDIDVKLLNDYFDEKSQVEAVLFSKILSYALTEGTLYGFELKKLLDFEEHEATTVAVGLINVLSTALPLTLNFKENSPQIKFDGDYLLAVIRGDEAYERHSFQDLPQFLFQFYAFNRKHFGGTISTDYFLNWLCSDLRIVTHMKLCYLVQFLAPHERFILFRLLLSKYEFDKDHLQLSEEFFLDELCGLGFINLQFSREFEKLVEVEYDENADLKGFTLKYNPSTLGDFEEKKESSARKALIDALFSQKILNSSRIGIQVEDDEMVAELYAMAESNEYKSLYINVLKGIGTIKNGPAFSEYLNFLQLEVKKFLEGTRYNGQRFLFICGLSLLSEELSSFQKKKLFKCIKTILSLTDKRLTILIADRNVDNWECDKKFFFYFPEEEDFDAHQKAQGQIERFELMRYKAFLRQARLESLGL